MIKGIIKNGIRSAGYDLVRPGAEMPVPPDTADADRHIVERVRPFTMTSHERVMALISAVRFGTRNGLEGSIVECGVFRGGSMMAAALTLIEEGDTTRDLYLYDTFEGMSEPTDIDKNYRGRTAADLLVDPPEGEDVLCYAPIEEVWANLAATGYPPERMHFLKGKVEETIPAHLPEHIALLRLDTDWYESTRHELEHLFPLLVDGGFLLIDDYGYWEGARKAVDEFLAASAKPYFLHRIDTTGRLLIK